MYLTATDIKASIRSNAFALLGRTRPLMLGAVSVGVGVGCCIFGSGLRTVRHDLVAGISIIWQHWMDRGEIGNRSDKGKRVHERFNKGG